LHEFFHMGGYGAYVWPAYGVSVAVLILMTWLTVRAYKKNKHLLHRLKHRDSHH